jgi:hypothetical protein
MSNSSEPRNGSDWKIALGFAVGMALLIGFSAWAFFIHPKRSAPGPRDSSGQPSDASDPAPNQEAGTAANQKAETGSVKEPEEEEPDKDYVVHADYSSDPAGLWTGTLSQNSTAEFLAQFAPERMANYYPRDESFGTASIMSLISDVVIEGKPVATLVTYSSPNLTPSVMSLRFNPDFFRAMLALTDSSLGELKAGLDTLLVDRASIRSVVENLLLARNVLETDPSLPKALDFIFEHHIRFDRVELDGFIARTYNDSLAGYIRGNGEYLDFWIDRRNDLTDDLAEELLLRIARRYFSREIRTDRLKTRALGFFREAAPATKRLAMAPVYFDTNSFIDPQIPPDTSRLDIRRKILRKYILSTVLCLADQGSSVLKKHAKSIPEDAALSFDEGRWESHPAAEGLSAFLFNAGSKYFSSNLDYYRFFRDPANNTYGWEPITLAPKLKMIGYGWDDGVYDMGVQLRPYPGDSKKSSILFAGFPNRQNPKAVPAGGRMAPLVLRVVEPFYDSGYCRKATETFAIPQEIKSIRSLFTKTFYRAEFDNLFDAEKLEGHNREGLVFANTGHTGESENRHPDTTDNMALQAMAGLYWVTPAQDTARLYTDSVKSGMADGETAYGQAARCRTPLFTDANGDRLMDLLVETSEGQVLFLQQRDGGFRQERF